MKITKLYHIHDLYINIIVKNNPYADIKLCYLLTSEAKVKLNIHLNNMCNIPYIRLNIDTLDIHKITPYISWNDISSNIDIPWDYKYIFTNAPLDVLMHYVDIDINYSKYDMIRDISSNHNITIDFVSLYPNLIYINIYSNPNLIEVIKSLKLPQYDYHGNKNQKILGIVNEELLYIDFIVEISKNPNIDEYIFKLVDIDSIGDDYKKTIITNIIKYNRNSAYLSEYFNDIHKYVEDILKYDNQPMMDKYIDIITNHIYHNRLFSSIISNHKSYIPKLRFNYIMRMFPYIQIFKMCQIQNTPFSDMFGNYHFSIHSVIFGSLDQISIMDYVTNFDMIISMIFIKKDRELKLEAEYTSDYNDFNYTEIHNKYKIPAILPCDFIEDNTHKLKKYGLEWDYSAALYNPTVTLAFINKHQLYNYHPNMESMLFCYDPILVSNDYKQYLAYRFMQICGQELKNRISKY